MTNFNIQDQLFREIKALLPPNTGIAEAVSDVLHLSTDSAYRRIRGETPLVVEELAKLCSHFHISADHLMHGTSGKVVFEDRRVRKNFYSYAEYLADLVKIVSALEKHEQKEVIYISKDLPIFYNFYYKPLAAFRYFFWMKHQFLQEDFNHNFFDINILPPSIEKMSLDLAKLYTCIPSVEMLNMESINSTISQIEFSKSAGHFKDPEDVIRVYESLEATVLHLQEQAEYGCKYLPGEDPSVQPQNLKLFFNRMVLGDNTILASAGERKSAFINYGHLNYLVTGDKNFCDALYEDFENLKKRSTLISVSSERQRNIFFNILLSKIRERKHYAGDHR